MDRESGVDQLTDELIGAVVTAVRPDRPQGHGQAWGALCANHDRISTWVKDGLTVVKIEDLLARRGCSCRSARYPLILREDRTVSRQAMVAYAS